MSQVSFNKGKIPETILPLEPVYLVDQIREAVRSPLSVTKPDLLITASGNPESIAVWCGLGLVSAELMESYAYFRLAYHRGLDSLRKNGWRGSGFVRWEHDGNRYFLTALNKLAEISLRIDDIVEADRCALFLRQLEPNWDKLQTEFP